MRWLLGLALIAGLAAWGLRHLPPEWDLRQPLDLAAPVNPVTTLKLRRLSLQPEACLAALASSGLTVTRVPDRASDIGCTISHAVRLPASVAMRPPGPVATCRLAVAWQMFERQVLQQAAQRHLGSRVVGIRHLGTQACRNINHAAASRRSQHATANAIDIAGFTLRDGREVTVLRDWNGAEPQAAFLRALRDGACRWFNTVLSPDYNAAHRNHFHFDLGPWNACR